MINDPKNSVVLQKTAYLARSLQPFCQNRCFVEPSTRLEVDNKNKAAILLSQTVEQTLWLDVLSLTLGEVSVPFVTPTKG